MHTMNDIFFLVRLQGLLLYLRCNVVLGQKLGRRNRENKKYRLNVLFHDQIFSFPRLYCFRNYGKWPSDGAPFCGLLLLGGTDSSCSD